MTPDWCLLAESASRTYYRFARLQAMSEWWHGLLLIAVCVAVAAYVIAMYWRDRVDLSRGVGWSLTFLRLLAFTGILFFFLDLEKRTEDREIKPSRAVLLVDTSQSMGLRDTPAAGGAATASRLDEVIRELHSGELLEQLRARHDLAVYQFGDQPEPAQVAFFRRTGKQTIDRGTAEELAAARQATHQTARTITLLAAGLLGLAAAALLVYLGLGRRTPLRPAGAFAPPLSVVALAAAGVLLATARLSAPDLSWRAVAGLVEPDFAAEVQAELAELAERKAAQDADRAATDASEPADIPWDTALLPRGTATRLGDALRTIVNAERGGPLAGIIVATDGGNNAGIDGDVAAQIAHGAGIPVFAVGLGSDRQPVNARVVDLEAPKRVYPGDKFTLTGYLQAYGLAARLVSAQLLSAPGDMQLDDGTERSDQVTVEEERSVRLAADGQMVTLKFEVTPSEVGARQFILRVVPPGEDLEPRDNQKTARVRVVERKSRVLLIAGGPNREYQFLRNQLFRDRDATVDVLLQTSGAGASQEATNILTEFPELADDLFQYDCIVAFDPDWFALNELQLELLDRWVAEQAGGLIVVAGPVFTPEWAGLRRGRDPRVDTIKTLYPVVFFSQGSPNLSLGRFGGESAWPLNFTRDGLDAEFLWLEDDALASEAAWQSFEGVFGYYSVKDPKPGARVYARFSNPETAIDGELPIYAAAHFYGSGRVFFQASGEMWRLRALEPRYFETYYTKLIRWVSQGRLLRDSSRGVLLVDKDRCLLGDTVTVRAVLNDAQHQALTVDSVAAMLWQPDGQRVGISLRKIQDTAREGTYEAQFTALLSGDYRIELAPPDSTDDELLSAEVRVRVPALEIERPQRNDALLKALTQTTGGEYYVGLDAAMNRGGTTRASLASALQPNDQVIYLPETMDKLFDERLMGWLLALIAGSLCLEWLLRRLHKLA
ncbi:MAG: VWA domain-containing protein [Planctomycetaceae bacterium]|nr:VWA domain-containing protein [Planctomycetaceae bacterium]